MMGNLYRILIILVAWLPLTALNAWAVEKLWNWYVPQIFNLQIITFAEAVGVALISTYLTCHWSGTLASGEKEQWEEFVNMKIIAVMKPLFAVFAGWVYLQIWPLGG